MLGLSIPDVAYRNTSSLAARVSALFRSGEQGVWYDPSDRATLFKDASGTTPVTAVEQPVGLMLDKSKGLVLGPELIVNSAWTASTGWSVDTSTGVATAIAAEGAMRNNGTGGSKLIAGKWYQATIRLVSYVSGRVGYPYDGTGFISIPTTPGTYTYRFLCDNPHDWTYVYCNAFTGVVDNISVRELPGNHAFQSTSASRPVLSARVNQYVGTATLATQNVTTLAATYTLRFEGTGSITLSGTATGTYSAGTHSVVCAAGTLTSTVTGTVTNADIRVANVGVGLPVYQRVTTSTDYDTAGFPAYLKFDGVDDFLVTNSIDFTATDKMTVCAGVRTLASSTGILAELSADLNRYQGTFFLTTLDTGGVENAVLKLTGTPNSSVGYTPSTRPVTYVASIAFDASTNTYSDQIKYRANTTPIVGTDVSTATGPRNFTDAPLYIGRRGGTTLPFRGHLYSLIIRGAASTNSQIVSVERYINGKTKAYA